MLPGSLEATVVSNKRVIAGALVGVQLGALAGGLIYIFGVLDPEFSAGGLSSDAYNARLSASGVIVFSVVATTGILAIRFWGSKRASAVARHRGTVRAWLYWLLVSCGLMIVSLIARIIYPRIDPRLVFLGLYAGIGLGGLIPGYLGFRGANLSAPLRGGLLGVSALIEGWLIWSIR
jgi:hypothetical protein